MNSERMAAVVPALQLLLADTTPQVQRQAFITAFPGNYLVLRSESDLILNKLGQVRYMTEELRGICDGSSALGILAAKNAGDLAKRIHNELRVLSGLTGVAA